MNFLDFLVVVFFAFVFLCFAIEYRRKIKSYDTYENSDDVDSELADSDCFAEYYVGDNTYDLRNADMNTVGKLFDKMEKGDEIIVFTEDDKNDNK